MKLPRPGKWIDKTAERLVDPAAANWWRRFGWLLLAFLLVDVVLGCYWSREPRHFEVIDHEERVLGELTTDTLIRVTSTLLDKPGGYLSNDIMPHRLWLDNMPNWEYGVLLQVRDLSAVMRRDITRRRDGEDRDLTRAASQFQFDHRSWAMPSTESEYRRGIKALKSYRGRLVEGEGARFRANAANLDRWLAEVQGRLDDLSLRLSQSVGRPVTGHGDRDLEVRTPRFQVDDIFFEARGTGWALYHLTQAVEQDFAAVLVAAGADDAMRRAIREFEAAGNPVRSPFILNGSGFGVFANHSLVMGNYLGRANAALGEVRAKLATGRDAAPGTGDSGKPQNR